MNVELNYHACCWIEAMNIARARAAWSGLRQRVSCHRSFPGCLIVSSV